MTQPSSQPSEPSQVTSPPAVDADEFTRQSEVSRTNQVQEILSFVKHERKWFLLPLLAIILLAGLFIVLSGTAVAPFIYTVF